METIKNMLNKAYSWVMSSPWRIATVITLLVLFIAWIALPIWTFLTIIAGLMFIMAIIGIFVTLSFKKSENKKMSDIVGIVTIVIFGASIVLFAYGSSLDPTVQAELKVDAAKKEADEKEKKEKEQKDASRTDKIIAATNAALTESLIDWTADFANGNEKSAWTVFVNKISADKDLQGIKIDLTTEANLLSPQEMYVVAQEAHSMSKRTINGVAHSENKDFSKDDVYDFFGFSTDADSAYQNPHAWLYRNDGTEVVHTSVISNIFERDSFNKKRISLSPNTRDMHYQTICL